MCRWERQPVVPGDSSGYEGNLGEDADQESPTKPSKIKQICEFGLGPFGCCRSEFRHGTGIDPQHSLSCLDVCSIPIARSINSQDPEQLEIETSSGARGQPSIPDSLSLTYSLARLFRWPLMSSFLWSSALSWEGFRVTVTLSSLPVKANGT
jgi:hypothetical protein